MKTPSNTLEVKRMRIKYIFAFLAIASILLSACAGTIDAPNHGNVPQSNNDMSMSQDTQENEMSIWDMIGTVSIVSNGVEHEPYMQFEHAWITTSEGQTSGSPPAPPSIEELLERLPKIQYSNDFQVIVDGEYATGITYSLREIEKFKRSYSEEGLTLSGMDELHFPETEGTYILVVRVFWSDSAHANWVHYSYISEIVI